MRAPRAVLLVSAWLAVVVAGSMLVWTVIAATGSELTGSDSALPRPDGTVATAPLPSVSPTPTPGASTQPSATASSSGAGSGAGDQPTAATSSAPSAPSATPRPTRRASSPAAVERSATWSGAAGVVTTRCAGSVISLVRAVPSADGYRVEVKDNGPREVEVEFEGRGQETEQETRVRAECVGGAPRYRVDRGS